MIEGLGPRFTTHMVSEGLELAPQLIESALLDLEKFGLIVNHLGSYQRTHKRLKLGDEGSQKAIRSLHEQIIRKALNAIHVHDIEKRELQTLVISVNKSRQGYLKKRIREFLEDLRIEFESEGEGDVLTLSLQLQTLIEMEGI